MRFAGKKVVVTGATRGIGRAIAVAFKRDGAFVIGTGTKRPSGVVSPWDVFFKADFGKAADISACARLILKEAPDVLVNNAGINKIAPFSEIDSEDFLRIQQVNVFAPFRLCQAAIPGMKKKRWGRIINISSIWGKIGREHRGSYAASKFAIDGLTVALALEHAKDGILANCVAPGFTDTELTRSVLGPAELERVVASIPIGRLASVDEIAELVTFLGSAQNTYMTGQNIAIDGGFTRA